MITKIYKQSTPNNRIRPPRFIAIGLAVVFLLLTAGLGRAFNPADLTLDEVGDGGYKFDMPTMAHRVHFPASLDSPVRLIAGDRRCEFTLAEMSYNGGEDYLASPQPASAVLGDDTVIYPNAFEGVDVEYQLTTRGIKEFFVLNQPPRAPAGHLPDPTLDFAVAIDAGDLKLYIDGVPAPNNFTTAEAIEFVDEAGGETVFTMPAPFAVDAAGDIIPIRYKVQTRGNTVRIYTQTPYAWLSDPARVYPVKIDPSATIDSHTAGYSILLWYGGSIRNGMRIRSAAGMNTGGFLGTIMFLTEAALTLTRR